MLGLEGIICNDYIQLDSEAYGVYELEILETQHGTELFYIDITNTSKTVTKSSSKNRSCDVSVSLTSSDLAGILTGKDEFRFILFLACNSIFKDFGASKYVAQTSATDI